MNKELYFCMRLTSSEHDIVAHEFETKCRQLGCQMLYYRELKDGHIPMYREVKLSGSHTQLDLFKAWAREYKYDLNIEKNPHKKD